MAGRKDFEAKLISLLPRLRRFAIGLSGSIDEGHDLVQAACLKAIEKRHQWNPDSKLDSWIYRIVLTQWLDRRKSAAMRLNVPGDQHWDNIAGPSMQSELESREELKKTWSAIRELPEDQRQVLLLVAVEGLSYQEAADLLGIPIGTVMSRLARSRLALARNVQNDRVTGKTGSGKPDTENTG
ncbi:RNA polymerase sigma-70 factor (ECF subfamily) [Dongia mobilis]|uniref:RNA polymerase sigma-70 factor (ECF subfamily) n=1 Tax=Dongia mobilis TaxID=578943 RepID=A0A4R6WEV0_9PROT|nr:RNA polymerase sigma factor [Dongia mobilis]TDQ78405.1 RNA polymerase sigma-70 factor (ECF subfamily) [Dongia mobilis]